MKKVIMKKWILILIGICIIGVIVFLIVNQKEKYFKNITIENNNIYNTIKEKNYLDTIVYVGIKSLDIDSLIIVIRPLTEEDIKKLSFDENIELKAYIKGMNDTYIIWVKPNESRTEYIKILSHELIHLEQYYTNKLVLIDNVVYWKNEKINSKDFSYEKRPWEIEAFSNQKKLEKKMLELLY